MNKIPVYKFCNHSKGRRASIAAFQRIYKKNMWDVNL